MFVCWTHIQKAIPHRKMNMVEYSLLAVRFELPTKSFIPYLKKGT